MLTGKQRSYLKGLAMDIDPAVLIGKAELTEATIKEMDNYLTAHELVKVKIQDNARIDVRETANRAAEALGAEFVQAIGRRFVLYRENRENRKIFF